MKRFRKIIFWCHLPIGVLGGLIILLMSVTGVLLTYERQIIAWADTRAYRDCSPREPRLPIETLLARGKRGAARHSLLPRSPCVPTRRRPPQSLRGRAHGLRQPLHRESSVKDRMGFETSFASSPTGTAGSARRARAAPPRAPSRARAI